MATVTGTGPHFSDGSIHVGVAPSALSADILEANVSNGSGKDAMAYVLEGNQVRLIGTLDFTGALSGGLILTLPSALWPPRGIVRPAIFDDGGTLSNHAVSINASGEVYAAGITIANTDKLYLDAISYEIGY